MPVLQKKRDRGEGLCEEYPIPPMPRPDPFVDPISVAVIELIAARGYEAIDVEDLVDRAGVTRVEFHRRFADKQDCTMKVMAAYVQDFRWTVETAYRSGGSWREGLRASAYAAADYLEGHPDVIQVLAVGLLHAKNEMLRVLREEALMYGATVIERGRDAAPDPKLVPPGAAFAAMGSIAQLLTNRLQNGVDLEPQEMAPQLLYLSVRPYLGEEIAQEELRAPRPAGSWVRRPAPGDPT
jgi:AcrR family transcriptional regulator